ncbi:hypothetical protein [Bradyrhizobium sp. WSM471]|uniref:hypothetical protein n=1 Tax=Bradyrhizobium sp. WSM471 TaxID=319017 RepID=UPI00024D2D99|nr:MULTISPECIES: hypothetical protein [Bradyrhizobium]EHR03224.1 hypothetical protein Bra471DRAFT_03993 [Bradyrhizobium sp. WSM471]UFW38452.1 hypothetical protein BcanWSM471_19595 [Bradyrhizobium canariense]
MSLTFRSTIPDQRVVVQQDPDGRRRVATATRNPGAREQWDLKLTHPSGAIFSGSFNGDGNSAVVALAELMARSNQAYVADRSRGDRPAAEPFDQNRRVDDAAVAPITPRR